MDLPIFRYVLYAAIIAFLVKLPQLRRVWSELDPRHRRILKTLFILLVLGQALSSKYISYPFVKWGMYSDGGSVVRFIDYRGVRADGSEAPFPISHLVRTHSTSRALECPTCGKRFLWRLRDMTKRLEKTPPGPKYDETFDLYQRTLRAAWRVYEQLHSDADFVSIRMFRNRTEVSDYRAGSPIESSFLWEVELEPETAAP